MHVVALASETWHRCVVPYTLLVSASTTVIIPRFSAMHSTARTITTRMFLESIVNTSLANASLNMSIEECGIQYVNTSSNNTALVNDVIRENFGLSVLEFHVVHFLAGVTPLTLSLATGTFMLYSYCAVVPDYMGVQ